MKDNEKKVKLTEEEAKIEAQTEEDGVELTEEQMSSVAAGHYKEIQNRASSVQIMLCFFSVIFCVFSGDTHTHNGYIVELFALADEFVDVVLQDAYLIIDAGVTAFVKAFEKTIVSV